MMSRAIQTTSVPAIQPWRVLLISLVAFTSTTTTHAGSVVVDGSMGGGAGPLTGPHYDITSSLGKLKGKTLFHSFSAFDLDTGDIATFSGPDKVRNILVRATGGSPSSIDGTMRSEINGANLFFLNPAGIMFGPNASLDLTGSFAATTADYLRLENGARFGVGLGAEADSALTTAPIVGFGFLGGTPGSIAVQGSLAVPAGKTITLTGGDVLLDGGQLIAPDGRVNIVSAQSAGEVTFQVSGQPVDIQHPAATIRMNEIATPGAIDLIHSSSINVNGTGGGNVVIRGGQLVVDQSSISSDSTGGVDGSRIDIKLTDALTVANNGQISTDTFGSAEGGDIIIRTPSMVVDGQDLDAVFGGESPNGTRIAADTSSNDAGARGGNIVIRADLVELMGGGEIATSSRGAADAGRVDIETTLLTLTGSASGSAPPTWIRANASPFTGNAGNGGDIDILADTILVESGALINADTQGGGNAGRINIHATSVFLLDGAITTRTAGTGTGGSIQLAADNLFLDGIGAFLGAETSGKGLGGSIDVTANSITMVNNSLISASSFGRGNGGNITVRAQSLTLDQADDPVFLPSGIIASSDGSLGKAGDIRIEAGTLAMSNGMQISTSSSVQGDGGTILIEADAVSLDTGASIQSAATGSGVAGGIELNVRDQLTMAGGSYISVTAFENQAGTISVLADTIRVTDSQITAEAPAASGGSIELFALQRIDLVNSVILASAFENGGNLSLGAPYFLYNPIFRGTMDGTTFISANAVNVGGNIAISSGFTIAAPENITATGAQAGNVDIGGPAADVSGILVGLTTDLLDADTELRPDCSIRLTGGTSSFIVLGRGGLPVEPGGLIPSTSKTGKDAGE